MKLTHVITTFDPGGAEHALIDLVKGLQQKDWQQKIIYLKGEGTLSTHFNDSSINVFKVPFEKFFNFLHVIKLLKNHLKDSHLVHSHLLKANSLVSLAWTGPHIGSRHNDEKILNYFFIQSIHRYLSKKENHHIAISHAVKNYYVNLGLCEKKFSVIPYGLKPLTESVQSLDLRHQYAIPDQAPLLLTAGRLVEQKGHIYLLNALSRWPEAHLIICGEGPLKNHLNNLCEKLNITKRVYFAGFRNDLDRFIVSCDLFVFPSLWEGLGRVLLEVMQLGCPIVASSISAIPEIVGDCAWLCPAQNADALYQSLRHAWKQKKQWPEIKQKMQQRVTQNFSLQAMIDQHDGLYQAMIHPL